MENCDHSAATTTAEEQQEASTTTTVEQGREGSTVECEVASQVSEAGAGNPFANDRGEEQDSRGCRQDQEEIQALEQRHPEEKGSQEQEQGSESEGQKQAAAAEALAGSEFQHLVGKLVRVTCPAATALWGNTHGTVTKADQDRVWVQMVGALGIVQPFAGQHVHEVLPAWRPGLHPSLALTRLTGLQQEALPWRSQVTVMQRPRSTSRTWSRNGFSMGLQS